MGSLWKIADSVFSGALASYLTFVGTITREDREVARGGIEPPIHFFHYVNREASSGASFTESIV
jgi:hypothetical protein